MATTAAMTEQEESAKPSRREATTAMVAEAADSARAAAADTAAKLPDLAAQAVSAYRDANRQVQAGSDQTLTIGTAVSFGFATGLLLGGANRLLVVAAFVPVAMMGLTLLDRSSQGGNTGKRAVTGL
jgi:hypothetical protein